MSVDFLTIERSGQLYQILRGREVPLPLVSGESVMITLERLKEEFEVAARDPARKAWAADAILHVTCPGGQQVELRLPALNNAA